MSGFYKVTNTTNGDFIYGANSLGAGKSETFFLDDSAKAQLRSANIPFKEAEDVDKASDFNGVEHNADEVERYKKEKQAKAKTAQKEAKEAAEKDKEKDMSDEKKPDEKTEEQKIADAAPTEDNKNIVGTAGVGMNTGPTPGAGSGTGAPVTSPAGASNGGNDAAKDSGNNKSGKK